LQAFGATAVVANPAVLAIGTTLVVGGVGYFLYRRFWGGGQGGGGGYSPIPGDDDDPDSPRKPEEKRAVARNSDVGHSQV